MENVGVNIIPVDSQAAKEYEKFARNFDLLNALFENQGISTQKTIEVLNEQMEACFEFLQTIKNENKLYKKTKKLYDEMFSYMNNLINENVF